MSEVVRRFLQERSDARHITSMTIDDVQHYSEEEKATIIASYPAHELEARTKGIPTLGSGRIFPVPEHALAIEHQEFPAHWPKIGGMDFGWDHPFAAVELVWDRDADIVYVTKTHRLKEATPIIHAAATAFNRSGQPESRDSFYRLARISSVRVRRAYELLIWVSVPSLPTASSFAARRAISI